jgi:hypothetical protein
MKPKIKYVEKCTGANHNGLAWISLVRFSKTGKTIYFKGVTLRHAGKMALSGNYVDEETGEEYWVSGPKQNGQDRHRFGSGPVEIDPEIADEYWQKIRKCQPPKDKFLIK